MKRLKSSCPKAYRILLTLCALSLGAMDTAFGNTDLSFTRQRLFSGFDGKTCKVSPEVATDGEGTVLMTWTKLLLTGSDVFSGAYLTRSTDGGKTWSEPILQEALADGHEGEYRIARYSGVRYSRRNRRWYALGCDAYYRGDKWPCSQLVNGHPYRNPLYVSVDAKAGCLTGWKILPFPFDYEGAMPFGQVVECENGELIVPFYFSAAGESSSNPFAGRSKCVTVRYAFDGDGLKVVRAGTPIAVPNAYRRGVCEPSLVSFGGRFYLTLRSDERGLWAESPDGLTFGELHPWRWENGVEIGNRNTQQHWLVGGDTLCLAYTRETPDNGHVFRNRAPIFMAVFDPVRKCLRRETERTLVPELGARLGNFCCTTVNDREAWLLTAEWMQSVGGKLGVCEKYGSDNSLWLVKVCFRQ